MTSQSLLRLLSGVAIAFGAVTVFSGGRALFGDVLERASVGNAVDFVLWFNFIAGFFYMLAGFALFRRWRCGVWLATLLAVSTALVAGAFGIHVAGGGAYEMRTVGALALRVSFWVLFSVFAWRQSASIK
ncbi:MAG: hypothetical protein KA173_08545 [Rhodoferax sp.]|nr:hypothetical protein [Rhodoferax sp.]MBP7491644.1 hypothetical protein [Rhodoferax sp.]